MVILPSIPNTTHAMTNVEIEALISTLEAEIEKLNARYNNAKTETHSFEDRREIRGKIREINFEIELLKRETKI